MLRCSFFQGSLFHSQESQNPSQFSGFLDVDALDRDFCNILSDDFKGFFNDDDEQSKIVSMQDDRNNHTPQKPLTGVFSDHSTDGSDSDPISATTVSKIFLFYLYYLLCFQFFLTKL